MKQEMCQMTNEIDVLKKAIIEHEKALHLKKINEELYSHLTGSVFYLLKYSEKYNVPLPKKEEILRMLEKSEFLIDEMISFSQPKDNSKNYQPDSEQNLETTLL